MQAVTVQVDYEGRLCKAATVQVVRCRQLRRKKSAQVVSVFYFLVDSEFLYYLAGAREVKKKTMSGMKFKKKNTSDADEGDQSSSITGRIEKGAKRFEKIKTQMIEHEKNMLEKLNLAKVNGMKTLVKEMSVKTMHADEFEANLVQLEQLIAMVAKSVQSRGKGGESVSTRGESEDEGEGEGEEQTYQRQQRVLFQELHSY